MDPTDPRAAEPDPRDLRSDPNKQPMTAQAWFDYGMVGLWKNRGDIGDSLEFARELRDRAQHRTRE